MPSEKKLFEYARENGWDKMLELSRTLHSLQEIELSLGRKIPDIEIRAMCALGLTQIVSKEGGSYALMATKLGLKLLEEPSAQNNPSK